MNPTIACQNMAPFAKYTYRATGALVDGKPLICSGSDGGYSDECYMITKSSTSFISKMNTKTENAASVVVNNNILWVLGGYDGSYLSSTEYIQIGIGSSTGPELPLAVAGHAMVALNQSTFMLIGGDFFGSYLSKTFYYQESNQDWIPGPEMDQARYWHAAGLGIDTATSEQYIAVTGGYAGYYDGSHHYLESVEILYSGETEWQTGKQRATTRPHKKAHNQEGPK